MVSHSNMKVVVLLQAIIEPPIVCITKKDEYFRQQLILKIVIYISFKLI